MVRVRRVVPVLLLLVAIPLIAQTPQASSRPPRDLHQVGDHWTAYNPPDPATYPAGARTHVIKAGDTLWALAQQYYGNAYLWPQLWEANTWITDAHWIYPGDVLLVEGEAQAVEAPVTTTVTEQVTDDPMSPVIAQETGLGSPVPLGTEADVYCYGYIGHPEEPMPNRISSFEDVEMLHTPEMMEKSAGAVEGELVFIKGGTATGLVAGETYMIIEPGDVIRHPRSKELIGQHYNYQGQVRILCAESDTARGIITNSCREVHINARLKPMPQLPIPIVRIPELPGFCDLPTGRTRGFIVDSQDWDLALGEGNLVQINVGRDSGLQPGDFLTVYRDSPIPGQPRQVLGELGILTTESRTATARIVGMRRAMQIGDEVELR